MSFGSVIRGRRPTIELGLDLGTTNTRVVSRGRGLVVDIPTTVAIQSTSAGREAVAFGDDAKRMTGRTSGNLRVVRPVQGGVIDDYEASERLISHVLEGAAARRPWRPPLLVAIPTEASDIERRALQESARAGGVGDVFLVSSALATALGAQLPLFEPVGSMVVTVGGGRTEVAVHSLGGIILHKTVRIAGDMLDQQIAHWLRRTHHVMVGTATAERIKIDVGAASSTAHTRQTRVRGRDLSTGAPRAVDLQAEHVIEAIQDSIHHIRDLVLEALTASPPEVCADIMRSGILLAGGSARLPGLDDVLRHATGLPVMTVDNPEHAVASGLAAIIDNPTLLDRVAH